MKNKTLEEIGSRLASARKDKGYTQEQLANLSGLSTKMISAAENGHKAMRPENIIKLCECLSISTDRLLCGESVMLDSLAEHDELKQLTPKQRDALSKIIDDFLSAFIMIVLSNDESDFLKNIAFCIQFFHRKSEFSQDEFTEKTGSICSVIFQIEFPFPLSHKGLFNMLSLN